MLFGSSIARRVQRAIQVKIDAAQKIYDAACREADLQCDRDVKEARQRNEQVKTNVADKLVADIIG